MKYWRNFLAIAMVSTPSHAADKWAPWVDVQADVGSHRSIGQFNGFAPLLQDESSLLFFNPRIRVDDDHSREYNFGVGYRQILTDEWALGAYGYVDRNRSETDHYYSQLTVGAELIGLNWKLRVNDYEPVGTRSHAGVSPAVIINGGTIQIASTTEYALRGNDAEIGYRIPMNDAAAFRQLWVYGGGYAFGADGTRTVAGPRARAEYEINNIALAGRDLYVRLSGEVQHDNVRDTQWFAGIRLGIPLGNSGRSEHTRALSPIERHMVDPVRRDVDIVTNAQPFTEAAALNGQPLNSFNIVRAGDNAPAIVAGAGDNALIVFDGSNGAISTNAPIVMAQNQTLLGAGSAISLRGAQTGAAANFTLPGTAPVVNGNVSGGGSYHGVVELAPHGRLIGLTLNNTSNTLGSYAISATNSDHTIILNNTATAIGAGGYGVFLLNSPNALLSGNHVSVTGTTAGAITLSNSGNSIITGNTTSALHYYGLSTNGSNNLLVTGNIFTIPGLGGGMETNDSDIVISNNTFNSADNLSIELRLDGTSNVSVSNNQFNGLGTAIYSAANTSLSGDGNIAANTLTLCNNFIASTGQINFVGGAHCP